MHDPTTPHKAGESLDALMPPEIQDVIDRLREAALLCGADGEMFAQQHLEVAADAIVTLCAVIRSVQAELLAGGSPARLRAIVGLIDKENPTNAERS